MGHRIDAVPATRDHTASGFLHWSRTEFWRWRKHSRGMPASHCADGKSPPDSWHAPTPVEQSSRCPRKDVVVPAPTDHRPPTPSHDQPPTLCNSTILHFGHLSIQTSSGNRTRSGTDDHRGSALAAVHRNLRIPTRCPVSYHGVSSLGDMQDSEGGANHPTWDHQMPHWTGLCTSSSVSAVLLSRREESALGNQNRHFANLRCHNNRTCGGGDDGRTTRVAPSGTPNIPRQPSQTAPHEKCGTTCTGNRQVREWHTLKLFFEACCTIITSWGILKRQDVHRWAPTEIESTFNVVLFLLTNLCDKSLWYPPVIPNIRTA